jgi:ribose-phosphate pyrophosphokinase
MSTEQEKPPVLELDSASGVPVLELDSPSGTPVPELDSSGSVSMLSSMVVAMDIVVPPKEVELSPGSSPHPISTSNERIPANRRSSMRPSYPAGERLARTVAGPHDGIAVEPDDIMLFAGSGSRRLAARIADYLGVQLCRNETLRFSEGNLFVRVQENVRGRRVYIVQSTVFPANDNFMELLFWCDAFRRASAESVTAVLPYFSYAKGDKKDEPRVSIRARVCADAMEAAGANRVVAMDLHAAQIQGFFRIPVDNLHARPVLCERLQEEDLGDVVVVSPDAGFAKSARRYASALGASVAIADKQRAGHQERVDRWDVIGDVAGKTAVVVDDFTISAGTLASAAERLLERKAKRVLAMVSHGVLTEGSMERLAASPIEKLYITDTVENHPVELSDKVETVSVAPLFGEAIKSIHYRKSISVMFPA